MSTMKACSGCQSEGQPVELRTIKALLTEVALRRFEPGAYRFCPDADCTTVYFDGAGHRFAKNDLRVPVWWKEPEGSRMMCYCFGENETDIRAEIEQTGVSQAAQRVRDHIAAKRCACEVRNPNGRCCLGDLTKAISHLQQSA